MIKINSIVLNDLIHYIIARIDIKNRGTHTNKTEVLFISDENAMLSFPEWFKNEEGTGVVIESSKGKLDLKIKCINEGNLNLTLRGIDAKDSNGTRLPIFIEFNRVIVNGKQLITENKLVSHDNPYQCNFKVEDGDIVFIHTEWEPFKLRNNKYIKNNFK